VYQSSAAALGNGEALYAPEVAAATVLTSPEVSDMEPTIYEIIATQEEPTTTSTTSTTPMSCSAVAEESPTIMEEFMEWNEVI
jgi:hypothetical protein